VSDDPLDSWKRRVLLAEDAQLVAELREKAALAKCERLRDLLHQAREERDDLRKVHFNCFDGGDLAQARSEERERILGAAREILADSGYAELLEKVMPGAR
jgi:hypothetical protein